MDIDELAERLKDGFYAAVDDSDNGLNGHAVDPEFWTNYARWWANNGKW